MAARSVHSVTGILFTLVLTLSLAATAGEAMAAARFGVAGGESLVDGGRATGIHLQPRPIGRFGVTWE